MNNTIFYDFKNAFWLKMAFLTFLSWGIFSSAAISQVPFANKYVKIKNVHSGKNLCTMHYSKDPKSNRNQEKIIQYSFTGDPTHIWLIKPAGNNLFILI